MNIRVDSGFFNRGVAIQYVSLGLTSHERQWSIASTSVDPEVGIAHEVVGHLKGKIKMMNFSI